MVKFKRGELVSYTKSENRKLGIVISDSYYSTGAGWQVKTYCDGAIHKNSVQSVSKVGCDDVEVIEPYHSGF